jgi:hypothetical protein
MKRVCQSKNPLLQVQMGFMRGRAVGGLYAQTTDGNLKDWNG